MDPHRPARPARPAAAALALTAALAVLAGLTAAAPATAQGRKSGPLPAVTPVAETATLFDDEEGGNANADDPAIRRNSAAPDRSLVVATTASTATAPAAR